MTLQHFEHADLFLLWFGRYLLREVFLIEYLWSAALVGLFTTAFGDLFLYAHGRLVALASESLARGLREKR